MRLLLCKEQFSFPMGMISALQLFSLSWPLPDVGFYGRNPATCRTSWVNLTLLCSFRHMRLFVAAVLQLLCFYCALSGVYRLLKRQPIARNTSSGLIINVFIIVHYSSRSLMNCCLSAGHLCNSHTLLSSMRSACMSE